MSRTNFDFSKHVHRVQHYVSNDGGYIQTDHFQVENNKCLYIAFHNSPAGLVVYGDFGNWMFDRQFIPSAESDLVSEPYWLEKLRMHSRQSIGDYSQEMTEESINELIESGLEDHGFECDKLDQAKEWFSELLDHTENECEYQYHAFIHWGRPTFIDAEMIPFHREIDPKLLIVMDAFDEMCNRLKQAK